MIWTAPAIARTWPPPNSCRSSGYSAISRFRSKRLLLPFLVNRGDFVDPVLRLVIDMLDQGEEFRTARRRMAVELGARAFGEIRGILEHLLQRRAQDRDLLRIEVGRRQERASHAEACLGDLHDRFFLRI